MKSISCFGMILKSILTFLKFCSWHSFYFKIEFDLNYIYKTEANKVFVAKVFFLNYSFLQKLKNRGNINVCS